MATDVARARVAVVTGGVQGIGGATSSLLADRGYVVCALDIVNESHPDPRVQSIRCDVTDSAAVEQVFAMIESEFGDIDITVCNAGIGGGAPVADLTDEQFDRVLTANLNGVFHTARAAVRSMLSRRQGCIVTIGSVFGQNPPAGTSAYAASKAGVAAFTRSLALEMAPHGIRVNCISPGHIDTALYRSALERRAALRGISLSAITAEEEEVIPLGRFGTPEDVARVICFLCSEEAAYITGQRINVDGGLEAF